MSERHDFEFLPAIHNVRICLFQNKKQFHLPDTYVMGSETGTKTGMTSLIHVLSRDDLPDPSFETVTSRVARG